MTSGDSPGRPAEGPGVEPDTDGHVENPYAPPSADLRKVAVPMEDAEIVRAEHIAHESSVKSCGCLLVGIGVLMGALAILGSGLAVVAWTKGQGLEALEEDGFTLSGIVLFAVMAWLLSWGGRGMQSLQGFGKVGLTLVGLVWLLGFPFGTLAGLYLLYLLHSRKGRMVLSEPYRDVVELTPGTVYETPGYLWILLMGAILVVVLIMVTLLTKGG